jgi:hypothetical protein
MNVENWAPILAAFTVVAFGIALVAGCGRDIDAEADRVGNYRKS